MTFAYLMGLSSGVVLLVRESTGFVVDVDRVIPELQFVLKTLDDVVFVFLVLDELLMKALLPHVDLRKVLAQECR